MDAGRWWCLAQERRRRGFIIGSAGNGLVGFF
jgi:hypothetical protein